MSAGFLFHNQFSPQLFLLNQLSDYYSLSTNHDCSHHLTLTVSPTLLMLGAFTLYFFDTHILLLKSVSTWVASTKSQYRFGHVVGVCQATSIKKSLPCPSDVCKGLQEEGNKGRFFFGVHLFLMPDVAKLWTHCNWSHSFAPLTFLHISSICTVLPA